jgi:hypothetical protein
VQPVVNRRTNAPAVAVPPPRTPIDDRREALEQLRRLAHYVQTTALLERRADRSGNTALAAILRERAAARRRAAELIRAHLHRLGLPAGRRNRDAG